MRLSIGEMLELRARGDPMSAVLASWRRFRARMQALLTTDDDVPCVGGVPYTLARCRQDRITRLVEGGSSDRSREQQDDPEDSRQR